MLANKTATLEKHDMNKNNVEQRRSLITGGSSGIGLAIAQAFAAEGMAVWIVGRDEVKLADAASKIDGDVKITACDLADANAATTLAAAVTAAWPTLDVLVNNAAVARFTPLAKLDEDEALLHLRTNVLAPLMLTRGLLEPLTAVSGCVVNVGSYFARRMIPGRPSSAYSATKGAMLSMTKALASELGPQGIRVNLVASGTVETPLVAKNTGPVGSESRRAFDEFVKANYPLGRTGQSPEVAAAVLYLADPARSGWITGAELNVDGGLTVT